MCGTATWADLLRAAAGPAAVLGVLVLAGCGGGGGSRNAADPRLVTVSPDTLAAWMEGGRPLAIYDLRPDSLFEGGRIPGSIHVRGMGLADFSQTLPPDPEAPVVFVSEDGNREPGSPDRAAAEAGYVRVLWLEGGYLAWKAVGYPTAGSRTFPR